MPSLRDLGEIEVIRRLIAARSSGEGVTVGPGDDAAVLATAEGRDLIATTDAFVEGRHFLPAWGTPREHGARLAAANLSDLAAMAARPRWALFSMGLRAEHDVDALLEFQAGVAGALEGNGAAIVGGNVTAVDGPEWFDLALLGDAPRGRVWTRAGARPGDRIAVTGRPGRAGAGARLALASGAEARSAEWRPLLDAWLRPTPRTALAAALGAAGGVRAAIDISDGLAGDLARLCEASGVGTDLDDSAWSHDPLLERAARVLGETSEALRLGPSDDYELVLAVAPEARDACEAAAKELGVPLAWAGRITARAGEIRMGAAGRPIAERGFDHFARAAERGPADGEVS